MTQPSNKSSDTSGGPRSSPASGGEPDAGSRKSFLIALAAYLVWLAFLLVLVILQQSG